MKYKRSYASEIVAIIIVIIGAFILIGIMQSPNSSSGNHSDSLKQLEYERKEARLNESPMTIEKARTMVKSTYAQENEAPEEEEKRLQAFVDLYNKQLESEQACIRKEKETEQELFNQNNQYAGPILIGAGVLITILAISALTKANEPSALTISDDKIDIKATVFREMKHMNLDTIKQIQYKIKVYRTNNKRRTYRMLYFKDENGNIIEELDLNNLADADFNSIYKEISKRAPHIEWIFPE